MNFRQKIEIINKLIFVFKNDVLCFCALFYGEFDPKKVSFLFVT